MIASTDPAVVAGWYMVVPAITVILWQSLRGLLKRYMNHKPRLSSPYRPIDDPGFVKNQPRNHHRR